MAKDKVKPRILTGFMELLPEEQILFNKIYDTENFNRVSKR